MTLKGWRVVKPQHNQKSNFPETKYAVSGEFSCLVAGFVLYNLYIFIPRHTIVAGYYGFTLVVRPSVRFSFPDDNLKKHQWIFTKLGMCIDIVEVWFGIANGQILSIFDGVICLTHAHIFVSGL